MDLGLTALMLARIQFAFTVSFHIVFPATSIGLPKVARANVANVMLDSIMDSQTFGQQVVVCPAKNVVKAV